MALVLASQSPRRRELMALVTPGFEVDEAAIDEAAAAGAAPAALVLELAKAKAAAVAARRRQDAVIGCDTVVELDGRVLGKPAGPAQATEMIRALSGSRHLVHTGVAVVVPGEKQPAASFVETTAVQFAPVPPAEIEAYVQTPEPYDKAGAYGIQGWAARFVLRVEGCYYNVMGLPVAALYHALIRLGLLQPGV